MLKTITFTIALIGALSVQALGSTQARTFRRQYFYNKTPPYLDPSFSIDSRLDDLVSRMSLQEKAGQMYHGRVLPQNPAGTLTQVEGKLMTHFVYSGGVNDVDAFIDWYNELQQYAINTTPLGIPITISTDPQHGWTQDGATSNVGMSFSRWTEPMGIAALWSPDLAYQYGDIVRQELAAVGIRQVLYPQVVWGRVGLTLGEDATLTTSRMLEMLKGFQGGTTIGAKSLAATVKHFPGGGPQESGEDPHFEWGKHQIYPGKYEDYHLIPFEAAIEAGVPQIMPYYSQPRGNAWDEVGFSFSKVIIKDLLQGAMGFEGIVVTDFGILTLTPWGVENRTVLERTQMVFEAGCDIIGGEMSTELLIQLVEEGTLPESRLDVSVRKLMKQKFELGLFDNPFIDKEEARAIVGNEEFRRVGNDTQRRSFTLLTNKGRILPLSGSAQKAKVYAEGIPISVLEARGLTVVSGPTDADYAFLRLDSPFRQPDGSNYAAAIINNGTLEFNSTERARQAEIYSTVPTIVDIKFNRPPAVPEVADQAAALIGSYGSSPDAFLDVVFGIAAPEGMLPFDMPRSNKAVESSFEDLPFDTEDPVFSYGHGLRYGTKPCIPRPRT